MISYFIGSVSVFKPVLSFPRAQNNALAQSASQFGMRLLLSPNPLFFMKAHSNQIKTCVLTVYWLWYFLICPVGHSSVDLQENQEKLRKHVPFSVAPPICTGTQKKRNRQKDNQKLRTTCINLSSDGKREIFQWESGSTYQKRQRKSNLKSYRNIQFSSPHL